MLLKSLIYLLRSRLELFLCELKLLVCEVSIFLTLHRDEVDVSVWNFKTENNLGNLYARESLLDSLGYLLCEYLLACNLVIFHIIDIVNLTTWDDKSMTYNKRIDVKKCVELIVLCAFIAWNFASCNF